MFTFVGLLDLIEDAGSMQADFVVHQMEHVGEVRHGVHTPEELGTGWVKLNDRNMEFEMSFKLPKRG